MRAHQELSGNLETELVDPLVIIKSIRIPEPHIPELEQEYEKFWRAAQLFPEASRPVNPNKGLVKAILGQDSGELLEVGSHNGKFSYEMAKSTWNITGIDISPDAIARSKATYQGVENLQYIVGDAHKLSGSKKYKVITLNHTMHHLNLGEIVQAMSRVLAPNGAITMVDYSRDLITEELLNRKIGPKDQLHRLNEILYGDPNKVMASLDECSIPPGIPTVYSSLRAAYRHSEVADELIKQGFDVGLKLYPKSGEFVLLAHKQPLYGLSAQKELDILIRSATSSN